MIHVIKHKGLWVMWIFTEGCYSTVILRNVCPSLFPLQIKSGFKKPKQCQALHVAKQRPNWQAVWTQTGPVIQTVKCFSAGGISEMYPLRGPCEEPSVRY